MTGRTLALTVRPYARRTLLALLAAGLILSFPGLALDASLFTLENLLIISPVILIGVGLTAGITASGSMGLIAAAFQGRDLRLADWRFDAGLWDQRAAAGCRSLDRPRAAGADHGLLAVLADHQP